MWHTFSEGCREASEDHFLSQEKTSMKKFAVFAVACLAVSMTLTAAEIKSGLQLGESAPAFNVRDVTGPSAGKTLCYRCKFSARPTVAIFTREVNDNVAELIAKVDAACAKNTDAKLASFVVVVGKDDSIDPKLKAIVADKKIANVPLTTIESEAGPDKYNLSKDAEVTVLMWNGLKVAVNHAFGKGELSKDKIDAIVADTQKILK